MDPRNDVLAAILARLRATASITALTGSRIYDNPPTSPVAKSPYISIGASDAISDDYDCIDGYEITFQIDVFSYGDNDAHSSVQASKIAHYIKKALHEQELPLTENALVALQHTTTRYFRSDSDQVNHAAVSVTAIVEEP